MWFFDKKMSLKDSGVFSGYTDWHSHILPGVDDGVKTLENSLKILEHYESLGFKKVWLTPHIMEDFPNETAKLRDRFAELKEAWKGEVEIALAAENMLDNIFEERLEKEDFLPIGEDGSHLLVETSYYTPPYGMERMIDKALSKGFSLILGHPERYRYMEEKDYTELKNKGLLFQMNVLSLTGAYGETARKKAEWLLKNDMIDLSGTDVHRMEAVVAGFTLKNVGKKSVEKLLDTVKSQALS
ncbi:MAG: capsular biosynthesis protein [Muribaculaceae bacterium]|nr:capsular biosynthesis protein [Muribaculaceae bacterium]